MQGFGYHFKQSMSSYHIADWLSNPLNDSKKGYPTDIYFLALHYNIAVEDERNVVYKSGGREQERGGRLVYLPNSTSRLLVFFVAIEVKGESRCCFWFLLLLCLGWRGSISSQLQIERFTSITLLHQNKEALSSWRDHPSCRQDRYDITKKERRKFACLSITCNGRRMAKFPRDLSSLYFCCRLT